MIKDILCVENEKKKKNLIGKVGWIVVYDVNDWWNERWNILN